MTSAPLDSLLERLADGDAAAVEQVFREYEPYLRMIVRRHLPTGLRARFDSVDVVQSVWADLFQKFRVAGWRFSDADHLRAFLVKVTRNRLTDRIREHHASRTRERQEAEAGVDRLAGSGQPRPSEEVQAAELWQRMLLLCPPAHRKVLELKRQGLPLAEVAAQTGLHEGSVRRILYDLARRLALQQGPEGARGTPREEEGHDARPNV